MRAMLESNGGMDALRNRAQAKKVLDFLRASAIIEDKVVTADSAAAEATRMPPTRRQTRWKMTQLEGGNE